LTIAEIARTEYLPVAYLEQLVGELRRAGLVESTRGVHGGYHLARPPAEITVGHLYRVLEGEVAPVECTAEAYLPGACARERYCLSRSIWGRVKTAILAVLDATTLGDLMPAEPVAAVTQFIPLEALRCADSLDRHLPWTTRPASQTDGRRQGRRWSASGRALPPLCGVSLCDR
jgi:Rrf2 family protein